MINKTQLNNPEQETIRREIIHAIRQINAAKDKIKAITDIIYNTDNEILKEYLREHYKLTTKELF